MKKSKSRKISDPWKEVKDYARTPKTKRYKQYPYKNWMDEEKRELSKVKKRKR